MSSIKKYINPTRSEVEEQKTVSSFFDIEEAFIGKCCGYIVSAYYRAIAEGKIQSNWSERTISRHLKKHLRTCLQEAEESIHVGIEYPEDNDDIDDGLVDSKTEIFFDLMLSTFSSADEVYFGVEAKILIEADFLKRKAKAELTEYVSEKGMRKFIDGQYKKRGCMIGYVMQGLVPQVVTRLNDLILANTKFTPSEIITGKHTINEYENCYFSEHTGRFRSRLRHLMLNFVIS